ncbi:MAG: endolytic transglycosylase MltG [Bacteroidales bacterium]
MFKSINRKTFLVILVPLAVLGIVGSVFAFTYYRLNYAPNTKNSNEAFIYIPTGSTFDNVVDTLGKNNIIKNIKSFTKVAQNLGYPNNVRAGRYLIKPGMGNRRMVTMLKMGLQKPLKLTFNNIRTPQQLAGRIARQIEADSMPILAMLSSDRITAEYGFSRQAIIAMFVPNTYEFYWNTNAVGFFNRMQKEYERFWTDERKAKAFKMGLTMVQISTLASIVEEETRFNSEKPRVAGVYLNRLRKGIPLQADPTIKFALQDFSIRRVLTKQLEVDSPYNTYKYRGLPPGPIRCPSITSIDAVLNAEQHSYLYFCAKDDFSGYHVFSKTLSEHNRNAEAYRRALNKEKIYR